MLADLEPGTNVWAGLHATLPAAAGMGLLAAAFATLPATYLFFFTTSTISVPLAIGGVAIAGGLDAARPCGNRSAETRARAAARGGVAQGLRGQARRCLSAQLSAGGGSEGGPGTRGAGRMTPLPYAIPQALQADLALGKIELFNAVLKEVATGRIVGHVQQTGVLDGLLGSAFQGVQSTLSGGFSPLGLISVIRNRQIGSQLSAMQGTSGLLQNLQIGTLALSGAGLGVSVVGFAMMLRRLDAIGAHLEALEARIEGVTRDRRADEIQTILVDIRNDLDQVDILETRRDPKPIAERAQMSMAQNAMRLEGHFARLAKDDRPDAWNEARLDMLWSLAAAMRLCHEAARRALNVIDDVRTAGELSRRQAERLLALCEPLSPDTLARMPGQGRAMLPAARTLVDGVRGSVSAVAAQTALAHTLVGRGIAGPAYLEAVAEETTEPLLYLPAGG